MTDRGQFHLSLLHANMAMRPLSSENALSVLSTSDIMVGFQTHFQYMPSSESLPMYSSHMPPKTISSYKCASMLICSTLRRSHESRSAFACEATLPKGASVLFRSYTSAGVDVSKAVKVLICFWYSRCSLLPHASRTSEEVYVWSL